MSAGANRLPPRPRLVIGREMELAHASKALLEGDSSGSAVALIGMRGSGKSLIAAELAQRLAANFEDGCVWVDVELSPQRAEVDEIAEAVLHHLDSGPGDASVDRRPVELARSVLRAKRVLVVIDGVEDAGQILDLIPEPGWRSALIVTSQESLRIDASSVTLDALSTAESIELLRATAGPDQDLLDDPELCAELVRSVGRLPLAIRLLGASVASHAGSGEELLHRLRNEATRSSFSDVEVDPPSIRSVLATSYAQLRPAGAAMLRLIGLLSDDGVTLPELQQASYADPDTIADSLDELLARGFIARNGATYLMHDLVRRFAREQLGEESMDSAAAQIAPSHLDAPGLERFRRDLRPQYDQAQRPQSDRIEVQEYALRVAEESGHAQAMVLALANLGALHAEAGNLDDAEAALRAGLALVEQTDDASMLAEMTFMLGRIEYDRGMLDGAEEHYSRSASHFERIGDSRGHIRALISLADVDVARGLYVRAAEIYETALSETPPEDMANRARGYGRLAYVADRSGNIDRARELYGSALRYAKKSRGEAERAELTLRLALLEARTMNFDAARELLDDALRANLRAGSPRRAARAALGLGGLALQARDWKGARAHFEQAADLADSASGSLAARALFGLALIARSEKDRARAISLLEKAAAGYRETHDNFGEAHALLALAEVLGDGDDEARIARETAQALLGRAHEQSMELVASLIAMTLDDREWAPTPPPRAATHI
jgi:tetratricopeptide (TPR) repeat protein